MSLQIKFHQPTEADFQRYYEINSDPETNLFNPHGAMNFEEAKKAFEKQLDHWKENDFGAWKVCEIENPDFVIGFGGLTFKKYNNDIKLNLGYRFDKKYWGKGYATALAKTGIDYAFTILNYQEVFALVRPHHKASIRVLEKCEMTLIGDMDDVPGADKSLIYRIEKAE